MWKQFRSFKFTFRPTNDELFDYMKRNMQWLLPFGCNYDNYAFVCNMAVYDISNYFNCYTIEAKRIYAEDVMTRIGAVVYICSLLLYGDPKRACSEEVDITVQSDTVYEGSTFPGKTFRYTSSNLVLEKLHLCFAISFFIDQLHITDSIKSIIIDVSDSLDTFVNSLLMDIRIAAKSSSPLSSIYKQLLATKISEDVIIIRTLFSKYKQKLDRIANQLDLCTMRLEDWKHIADILTCQLALV